MATTIALMAHVDAGKTTLSEHMLLVGGRIRKAGRVDRGTSKLDWDQVERARGITVYAAQADFSYEGRDYTLIDTPGHADFAAQADRVLPVLDGALLLLDGTSRPGAHFAALYRRLAAARVPTLLVLTKADRPTFDLAAAARSAAARLGVPVIPVSPQMDGAMAEALAEADDQLMARYLEDAPTPDDLWAAMARLFAGGTALLAVAVSGLTGQGVCHMLAVMNKVMAPRALDTGAPEAPVYQVRVDASGQRVCFCRVLSGALHVRDEVAVGEEAHKITALRAYAGDQYIPIACARAGQAVGVVGLPARAGDVIRHGRLVPAPLPCAAPMRAMLTPVKPAGLRDLGAALNVMTQEEPLLDATPRGMDGFSVCVTGQVQLEVTCQVLGDRFGVPVTAGAPQARYFETVSAPVLGMGHYEPLRHYAEVQLALVPGPPGSGIQFESLVPVDELALNWQRLIRTHVLERPHPGPLTGAPLTDARVLLLGGRAHLKHTEGGDFRQATCRAIRQALFSAQPLLLEPWITFEIGLPLSLVGRAMADVQRLHGQVTGQQTLDDGTALLMGDGPLPTLMDYPLTLAQYAKGEGHMACQAAPPRPCHDAQAVIDQTGYDRGADTEHPAWSVFCAKGAGYQVPWDRVGPMMHGHIPAQRLRQAGLTP